MSTRGVTGGTFTLSYVGEETTAIPWNATADTLQAALEVGNAVGTRGVPKARHIEDWISRFTNASMPSSLAITAVYSTSLVLPLLLSNGLALPPLFYLRLEYFWPAARPRCPPAESDLPGSCFIYIAEKHENRPIHPLHVCCRG